MEEGRAFLLVQLENIGRSDEGILNLESIRKVGDGLSLRRSLVRNRWRGIELAGPLIARRSGFRVAYRVWLPRISPN